MKIKDYKEKLYKFIDTSNLSDEDIERIYNRENQKRQKKLDQQMKVALIRGIDAHRLQRKRRA